MLNADCPSLVVLASFNMDLVMRAERLPERGETLQGEFAMHLGGKGFNQAVAARRLGADVAVIGRVGDDEFGRLFLDALDSEGIDRRCVLVDERSGTGVASIIVEPNGHNTVLQATRANRNVSAAAVDSAFDQFGDHRIDAALTQLETSLPAVSALFGHCAAAGITTVFNPAPALAFPSGLLAGVDVVIANELEATAITGASLTSAGEAEQAAERLTGLGASAAVVTIGDEGCVWHGATHSGRTPPFDVSVVDTTGAGDAFCAALTVRLAEGADLPEAVRFASAAGALACTVEGAYPSMPHRNGVETLLAKGATR